MFRDALRFAVLALMILGAAEATPAKSATQAAPVAAQAVQYPDPTDRVLTHREQAPLVKGWIEKRFDTLMPNLMQRTGIDMWIIVSREYNDDPVFRSMAAHQVLVQAPDHPRLLQSRRR